MAKPRIERKSATMTSTYEDYKLSDLYGEPANGSDEPPNPA